MKVHRILKQSQKHPTSFKFVPRPPQKRKWTLTLEILQLLCKVAFCVSHLRPNSACSGTVDKQNNYRSNLETTNTKEHSYCPRSLESLEIEHPIQQQIFTNPSRDPRAAFLALPTGPGSCHVPPGCRNAWQETCQITYFRETTWAGCLCQQKSVQIGTRRNTSGTTNDPLS